MDRDAPDGATSRRYHVPNHRRYHVPNHRRYPVPNHRCYHVPNHRTDDPDDGSPYPAPDVQLVRTEGHVD